MAAQRAWLARAVFLVALGHGAPAVAETKVKVETQGYIETDVRFSLPGKANERADGQLRFNENRFAYQIDTEITSNVSARAAGRTVFVGFSNTPTAFDLTQRAQVDPFWWELDAAYFDLRDLGGIEGLDLRAGRQVIRWGTADQFNPTNNLNPLDLRDPLLFGQNLANNAIKLDYNLGKDVVLTGVWVPVFRTTQLPLFGLKVLSDPAAARRRFGPSLLDSFGDPVALGIQYDLRTNTPETSLRNSMAAAKVAFKLLGMDLSLSYFKGRFHTPRPEVIKPSIVAGKTSVQVEIGYPEMQAFGFDMTTSVPFLKGLGLWVEGALVFHDDLKTTIDLGGGPALAQTLFEGKAGNFLKLTAGMDYSFTKQLYMNVQYLHGFVDEFGSRQLGDYVVAGIDIKSKSEKVLLRLFGVVNLQDGSHVYFPSLILKPWGASEFQVGALLYGGEPGTKFGGLESGSNLFFVKGRISF